MTSRTWPASCSGWRLRTVPEPTAPEHRRTAPPQGFAAAPFRGSPELARGEEYGALLRSGQRVPATDRGCRPEAEGSHGVPFSGPHCPGDPVAAFGDQPTERCRLLGVGQPGVG